MNVEYIFKLFNDSIEHKSDNRIETEIMLSAHYNVKMFIKYITNLKNFQIKLLAIAQNETKKDLKADAEKAELLGYNKAFFHISKVNIYNTDHINDLDLINPFDFSYCIQVSKTYFLSNEDYDKVSFLVEMSEFVEKRYKDLNIEE